MNTSDDKNVCTDIYKYTKNIKSWRGFSVCFLSLVCLHDSKAFSLEELPIQILVVELVCKTDILHEAS